MYIFQNMKFKVKHRLVDDNLIVHKTKNSEVVLDTEASLESVYKTIKEFGIQQMKSHLEDINKEMSPWDGIIHSSADFGDIKVFAVMRSRYGDEVLPLKAMLTTWEIFNGTREVDFRYKPHIFTFIETITGFSKIRVFFHFL